MKTHFSLGTTEFEISLPDSCKVLSMKGAERIDHPQKAIEQSLEQPIGSPSLYAIAKAKLAEKTPASAKAVIVISDNTRPVPYTGPQGILLPIVRVLLKAGFSAETITILCANGTHVPLSDQVFREMLDPEIFALGIPVVNHDCLAADALTQLGYTKKGTKVEINSLYVAADVRIITGLVESHFMAGVSGGRKSICPGLIGEDSTFIFHGVSNLSHACSRDITLEHNPCHEEALEVASFAPADFMVNVTLDHAFSITGVFSGDMHLAHLAAFEFVKESVGIETGKPFDIVITHAGFVGKNHYQAAKAAVAALPLLQETSTLIIAGNCTDTDPVGKPTYRQVLKLLKNRSSEDFIAVLSDPSWKFVPDQWQVQMWSKVFSRIPQEQFFYYAPQISEHDYAILPGVNGNTLLPENQRYTKEASTIPQFLEAALAHAIAEQEQKGKKQISIAWLADGPYGVIL